MPLVDYTWAEVLAAEWPGAEWSLRGDDLDTLEWVGDDRPSKAEIANRAASGWLKTAKRVAFEALEAQATEKNKEAQAATARRIRSAISIEQVEGVLSDDGWSLE